MPSHGKLPAPALLKAQSAWLEAARARLLRRTTIARRQSVLDLGVGYGLVTAELARRCGGRVVGFDLEFAPLSTMALPPHTGLVCGRAECLPFAARSFDLVFSQCALMWMEAEAVIREIHRVLAPGGTLAVIEPDYGGMIEYPESIAIRSLWEEALEAGGADPRLGRKLPGILQSFGFDWRVELLPRLHPPATERYRLLQGILNQSQSRRLEQAESAEAELREKGLPAVVHLPFFLVTASKVE